jgi:hypothetical protein
MAGTLNVTTISGISTLTAASGVLATQNGMTGIAKAWVNYKGTATVSIRASFNVSSVTVNGTGDYTINMTTALADANYAVCLTNCGNATGTAVYGRFDTTAPTSSAFRILTVNAANTAVDSSYVMASVFGT